MNEINSSSNNTQPAENFNMTETTRHISTVDISNTNTSNYENELPPRYSDVVGPGNIFVLRPDNLDLANINVSNDDRTFGSNVISQQPNSTPEEQQQVVTTVLPDLVVGPQVGPDPQVYKCTYCSRDVITSISYAPSMRTHLMVACLCLLQCYCCLCIPYCIKGCNNVDHYCPHCRTYLGTYIH